MIPKARRVVVVVWSARRRPPPSSSEGNNSCDIFTRRAALVCFCVCWPMREREKMRVWVCVCMLVRERMIRGKSNPYSLHLKLCCERLCQPPYQSQMTRLKCKNGFQIIARVLKRLGLFCTEIRCIIMMAMRMMTIGCKWNLTSVPKCRLD